MAPTVGILAGLLALVVGAELLVRGATSLAARLRVPPLIVGLTVVAWGTSAPEAAVGVSGALTGSGALVAGNVAGSNIFNTLFILGLGALLAPLAVQRQAVRRDIPLMIVVTLALLALGWNGLLGRLEGWGLLAGLLLYTVWLGWQARRTPDREPAASPPLRLALALPALGAGLVLLAFGARWLTEGAVAVAAAFGVGERVIGLTVVAVGTSLPEVAASVVAALRGQRDLSVGNVVGSNLFNLLGVLGLAAVVAGEPVELPAGVLALDLPVALAGAVAVAPLALSGGRIDRLEGALLLAGYGAYTGWVLAGATFAERPGTGAALLAAAALAGVVAVLAAFRHRGGGPPGTP